MALAVLFALAAGILALLGALPSSAWARARAGPLAVGGDFGSVDGRAASRVALWEEAGSAWRVLPGAGLGGGDAVQARALLALPNGELVCAGEFAQAGGVPASNVARWNGAAWTAMGSGVNAPARALALWDGDVVVAGRFTAAGPTAVGYIARWAGDAWTPLGAPATFNNDVVALVAIEGSLFAGGAFTANGLNFVARWDGALWNRLGTGVDLTVYALAGLNGDLYAGGAFATAGGVPASNVARWNGVAWSALGTGTDSAIFALHAYNGALYAGGWFGTAGGVAASMIARFDGTAWSAVGSGLGSAIGVYALAAAADGRLYAGGAYVSAPFNYIAAWDGAAWTALQSGANGTVWALGASCERGWALPGCDQCAARYFGPSCTPCTDCEQHGVCNEGLGGSCQCDDGWTGAVCAQCTLGGADVVWRAQYYLNDSTTILVEDHLVFTGRDRSFAQNVTAFPFQACAANWIDWRGSYEQVDSGTLLMSYVRCTQSGRGCVSCTPTHIERVKMALADDCSSLVLQLPDDPVGRTYYPLTLSGL